MYFMYIFLLYILIKLNIYNTQIDIIIIITKKYINYSKLFVKNI